jgi:hypothetical protein
MSLTPAPTKTLGVLAKTGVGAGAKTTAGNIATKLSKVEKSTSTTKIGDKFTKTTTTKPGKGPGQSRSEMKIYKSNQGKAVKTQKDSYDRATNFNIVSR